MYNNNKKCSAMKCWVGCSIQSPIILWVLIQERAKNLIFFFFFFLKKKCTKISETNFFLSRTRSVWLLGDSFQFFFSLKRSTENTSDLRGMGSVFFDLIIITSCGTVHLPIRFAVVLVAIILIANPGVGWQQQYSRRIQVFVLPNRPIGTRLNSTWVMMGGWVGVWCGGLECSPSLSGSPHLLKEFLFYYSDSSAYVFWGIFSPPLWRFSIDKKEMLSFLFQ